MINLDNQELAGTLASLKTAGLDVSRAPESPVVSHLGILATELQTLQDKLVALLDKINAEDDAEIQGDMCSQHLTSLMEEIRSKVDRYVSDDLGKLGKYDNHC